MYCLLYCPLRHMTTISIKIPKINQISVRIYVVCAGEQWARHREILCVCFECSKVDRRTKLTNETMKRLNCGKNEEEEEEANKTLENNIARIFRHQSAYCSHTHTTIDLLQYAPFSNCASLKLTHYPFVHVNSYTHQTQAHTVSSEIFQWWNLERMIYVSLLFAQIHLSVRDGTSSYTRIVFLNEMWCDYTFFYFFSSNCVTEDTLFSLSFSLFIIMVVIYVPFLHVPIFAHFLHILILILIPY